MVTISLKRTGSAVAWVQDEVVVLTVDLVVVVVEPGDAQGPLLVPTGASMSTRGRPDAIGTAIFPLESTVIDVQVYISMRAVPEEYPLPLRLRV